MKQKNKIKNKIVSNIGNKKDRTDWKRLRSMSDAEIDCSDIPDISSFNWTDADIVLPEAKTRMTIRIDTDVYQFFKISGPKYQSRMNAVLKSYMESQLANATKVLKKKAI